MSAFTIDMSGGPPWGFSMQGGCDFNQPLNISKVSNEYFGPALKFIDVNIFDNFLKAL